MSLQVLEANRDVVGHIKRREVLDSWACLLQGRPEPFHQWRKWGVPDPGCGSCQDYCVGGSWRQVGSVHEWVYQGGRRDAGEIYAGLLCHFRLLGDDVLFCFQLGDLGGRRVL